MKTILTALLSFLLMLNAALAQNQYPSYGPINIQNLDAAIGIVPTTDVFNYQGRTFSNYGLGWVSDTWNSVGPTAWLSGFAGIKFFTAGVPQMSIASNGNVGIGTSDPGPYKLAVEGKIGAREIKVTVANPWADYVFTKNYKLKGLYDLDKYIKMNNHLPGIPSAKEVEENGGVELGKMNVKLLEKVEELTLYVIQLKKENDGIKKQLKQVLNKK